jgi:hypothetical protein
MAALAGVRSCGTVFHTKIARSPRRACNFMIPKGESAPAVFSIPIARSTFPLSPAMAGFEFSARCEVWPRRTVAEPLPTPPLDHKLSPLAGAFDVNGASEKFPRTCACQCVLQSRRRRVNHKHRVPRQFHSVTPNSDLGVKPQNVSRGGHVLHMQLVCYTCPR